MPSLQARDRRCMLAARCTWRAVDAPLLIKKKQDPGSTKLWYFNQTRAGKLAAWDRFGSRSVLSSKDALRPGPDLASRAPYPIAVLAA